MIAELQTALGQSAEAGQSVRLGRKDPPLTKADAVKIKVDRHALLMRGAPIAIGVSVVLAILTAFVAWPHIDKTVISVWAGLVVSLAMVRMGLWLRHARRKSSVHSLFFFTRMHVIGMALNGALWGALAPIFAMYGMMGNAYLPFVIAGMTAAALTSAGASWRAVQAFNIPVLLSLATTYAVTAGSDGAAIAGVVILYGMGVAYLSWSLQQMLMRLIKLRSRNAVLLKTAMKQMDAAQDAEKRFRALVEATTDVTIIFSPDGHVTYASPSVEKGLGFAPQTIIGMSTKQLVHPQDFPIFKSVGARSLSKLGEVMPLEHICFVNKDGAYVALSGRVTNMLYIPGVEGFVFNGGVIRESADQGAVAHDEGETPTSKRVQAV